MVHVTTSERNLGIIEEVLKGDMTATVASRHGMTVPNVRRILSQFCNSYLQSALHDGSPEVFYPGADKESAPKMHNDWLRNSRESQDITARDWQYRKQKREECEQYFVDYSSTSIYQAVHTVEEVREHAQWWLHQIVLLRFKRQHPPKLKEFANG